MSWRGPSRCRSRQALCSHHSHLYPCLESCHFPRISCSALMASPAAAADSLRDTASAPLSTDQASLLHSSLGMLSSALVIFQQKVERLNQIFGAGANDARAEAADLTDELAALEKRVEALKAPNLGGADESAAGAAAASAEVAALHARIADVKRMLTATHNWLAHFTGAMKTINDRIEWMQRILNDAAATPPVEVALCFLDALDLMLSLRLVETHPEDDQQVYLTTSTVMREWAEQANLGVTVLVESLTPQQLGDRGAALVSAVISPGALSLVPGILRKTGCACVATYSGSSEPQLNQLIGTDLRHPIDLIAWLGLIRFGLDPAIGVDGQPNSSALHLMRKYVAAHPWPEGSPLPATPAPDSSLPNFVPAYASVVISAEETAEQKRREALRCGFMHAFHLVWREHSAIVRRLLCEAAPAALIPDLAHLCGDYLDLDRV